MDERQRLKGDIADLYRALEATSSDEWAILYGKQLDRMELELDNLPDPLAEAWADEPDVLFAGWDIDDMESLGTHVIISGGEVLELG